MAIVDYINLGTDLAIVVADADPTTSGIDVPVGSLLVLNNGSASYFKSGSLSTDWSLSLLGSGTVNKITKFTGTGVVGNSNIQDDGTTVTFLSAISASSFSSASGVALIAGTTWAGVTQDTQENFTFTPSTYTIGNNLSSISVAISGRTLTVGSAGTHNIVSQLALDGIVLNTGTGATTTNAATLYIQTAATGTAAITNNYAIWVDNGVTRLDGTAIINGGDSTTNSVKPAGYFQGTLTTGTPAVGIGTSYGFNTQTAASTYKLGSTITSVSTNVGTGTEAFDLFISTMSGGAAAAERLRILSTGQIKLSNYTTISSFTGTPVAALMSNSSGNILTIPPVLQTTSLTISAAAVTGAFTTPITLVAAQGAGKVILPTAFIFKLTSAGTAFATNTNYQFLIGTQAVSASRSFAGTTSAFTIEPMAALAATATANLDNQALVWKVLTGNPTGGTGATISIGVIYSVITI